MAKDDIHENVIEWITGDDFICCTFTQKKYINKVRKLADDTPENVPVLVENNDGSIFCHLPLKMLKLYLKKGVDVGFKKRKGESGG